MLSPGRSHELISRDRHKNLLQRKQVYAAAKDDEIVQHVIRQRCRDDILFWWNLFVWQFDPSKRGAAAVAPFILYPFHRGRSKSRPGGFESCGKSATLDRDDRRTPGGGKRGSKMHRLGGTIVVRAATSNSQVHGATPDHLLRNLGVHQYPSRCIKYAWMAVGEQESGLASGSSPSFLVS